MGVMEQIRGGTDSSLMKFVLIAIVITFVFWGIGGSGDTSTVVATVNGERITDTEFTRRLRQASASQSRTMSDAEQAQLREQVLNGMIEELTLLQEADRLGIQVSDDEIAWEIRQIDVFRDDRGSFSFEQYERHLARMGLTKGQFQEQLRRSLTLRRLLGLAAMAVHVPPGEIEDYYVDLNTRVDLRWARFRNSDLLDDTVPTPEELAAWQAEHAEALKQSYDDQLEKRFTAPRTATMRTILLRNDIEGVSEEGVMKKAGDIRQLALEGADFAELAQKWSEDLSARKGGDIGTQEEGKLDPAIAEKVFETEAGQITEVIETSRGFQVVQVLARTESVVTSFDDAIVELATEAIQADRAPALAAAYAEELLAEWKAAGFAPISVLDAQGIAVQDSPGVALSSGTVPGLPAGDEILAAAESAVAGQVLDQVFTSADAWMVAQVTGRDDADMDAYADQAGELRTIVTWQKRQEFAVDYRNELVAQASVER